MKRFQDVLNRYLKYLWIRYAIFINQRTHAKQKSPTGALNWQNKFFTQIIRYGLPTATVAIIASGIVEYHSGDYVAVIADFLIFASIIFIVLHQKIPIYRKKIFGVLLVVIFSVAKIITLQSLMFGSMSLLLSSVFTALLFNKRAAYFSVAINASICIYFTILQIQSTTNHSLAFIQSDLSNSWMIYSFNFIFINFIIVSIVLYIIHSFEKNINKSERLRKKLKLEVQESITKGKLLQESITHYKGLFIFNPLPMMIYNPNNLKLLYVNKAAIDCYGYNRREFTHLEVNMLCRNGKVTFKEKVKKNHIYFHDKHYHKNGETLLVDIHASNIKVRGKLLRLAIIRDITAEKAYIDAIEKKNEKMKEIAYLQSHVIRNPLSRILGITQLMMASQVTVDELALYLPHLTNSAKELDHVVTNIVRQTENELREN